MDIRFTHTSLVFGFENIEFDAQSIYKTIILSVNEIMTIDNLSFPDDWSLLFKAIYTNGRQPLVSTNKIGGFPSDRMKYISIVIPVPLKSEIEWGVKPEQHLYGVDHYDKLIKNFWELDIDYRNFSTRTDYIIACLKSGIKRSFEEGFTVGGSKIKVKGSVLL